MKQIKMNVKISILMSVYNEPLSYVKSAILSMQNQSFKDYEFIIVLDNPDNYEILTFLKNQSRLDKRIVLLENDNNLGLAKSLNKGIKIAKGEYIARMDADDIAKPQRLEHELKYIQENNFDMVGCLVDKIDENEKIWDTIKPFPETDIFISKILPLQNIIVHPTVLIKKEVIQKLNGYRPFSTCQDYDLWLRMLTDNFKIGILNESLLYFRRHRNSITASKRYIQILNENYMRKMYNERIKYGKDSFSMENLSNYLSCNGVNNIKKIEKENKCFSKYNAALRQIKNHHLLKGLFDILTTLNSYSVRTSIKNSLKARKLKKRLTQKI